MISRRTLLATVAAAPLASLASRAAFAAYPDKPVRLIVPFAAGGNADFVARLCGEMSQALGQPFVVEYRTGAGGSLGAERRPGARPTATRCSPARTARSPSTRSCRPSSTTIRSRTSSRSGSPTSRRIASRCSRVPAKTLQELIAMSKTSR